MGRPPFPVGDALTPLGVSVPAFDTNAICRRQIQPGCDDGSGTNNAPGWIVLPDDGSLREPGGSSLRLRAAPTDAEPCGRQRVVPTRKRRTEIGD